MPLLHDTRRRHRPAPSLRGQRAAITALFALDGLVFGSWAARIPDLAAQAGAGHVALGLVLLCLSVGALASMQLTGMLCARLGAGAVASIAAVLTSITITLPGAARTVAELAVVVLGLGAATGMLNVSINAVGVRVERAIGRSVVPSLHAAFSAGGLAGAALTSLLTSGFLAADVGVAAHLIGLGVLGLVATAVAAPVLLAADERVPAGTRPPRLPTAVRRAVAVFGIVAACTAFGEGAVTDWGALFLREVLGAEPGRAAAGYACFSIAMATGRLVGGRLLDRFGATPVLVVGSLLAAGGALLVAASPVLPAALPLALVGFTAVGLGLANVFPVAIGRAGALGGPAGVALASTVGYAGLLGGPPLLGFLAHATGMATGFVAIAVLAVTAGVLALLAPPEGRSATALLHQARVLFARVVLEPAATGSRRAVRGQARALDPLWPAAPPAAPHHRAVPYPGLEALVTTPLR